MPTGQSTRHLRIARAARFAQSVSQPLAAVNAKRRSLLAITLYALAALAFTTQVALANPVLDETATPAELEDALEGPGIILEPGSLTVLHGESYQYGTLTNGDVASGAGPVLGIEQGIFMVTGQNSSILGPNNAGNITTNTNVVASDPELVSLNSGATRDPVVLQLQVTPQGTFLKFLFVFGSDEYPEYVCSIYNDSFGFFIKPVGSSTWQNAALTPGTSQPITVNTVNNGSCGSSGSGVASDLSHGALYVDNGIGETPTSNANLQLDGFTIPMIVTVPVTAGQQYDVKLAIADVGDPSYDSAVFIKWIMASDFLDNADVELALSVDDPTPALGDSVNFTLAVTNDGPDAATNVQAVLNLPPGFSYTGDNANGSYDDQTGTWTLPGSLASGASQSIDISATVGGAAAVTSAFAEVTSLTAADEDSTPANGSQSPAEDDEATLSLTVSEAPDRSDAPITGTGYGSAAHRLPSTLRLGTRLNGELSPNANADASGDSSDDGVIFPVLTQGASATISVSATGSGYLQAWIDWDANGSFADSGEQVSLNVQDGGAGDSDGVVNGAIALSVSVPANSTSGNSFARFRWSSEQSIGAEGNAADGEVEDYQISFSGIPLSGNLFVDNGAAGGNAHDGVMNGAESGAAAATVRIVTEPGGALLAQADVDPAGNWQAILPAGTSGQLRIEATATGDYILVSESTGTLPAPINPDTTDGDIVASVAIGQSYTGIDFGTIRPPLLSQNQAAGIEAGQGVALSHLYQARSAATVTFALVDLSASPAGGFSATLYRDSGCDGSQDSVLTAPMTVSAGDSVCLIIHVQAANSIGPGAQLNFALTADTGYTGLPLTTLLRNDDTVAYAADRLELSKRVRNITASGAEGTMNTGTPGDLLEYRLVLRNASTGPATDVTVNDSTPAWTTLAEPISSPSAIVSGVTCVVTTPNTIGYAGPIEWDCDGSFPPGGEGALIFRVQIE